MNTHLTKAQLPDAEHCPHPSWYDDLLRSSRAQTDLAEAFQIVGLAHEEGERTTADLREREIWAMTLLVEASAPLWRPLPSPTIRFETREQLGLEKSHIELGRFTRLAQLIDPSEEETSLARADAPRFARVYPHHERRAAGATGALACSYVPLSVADGVGAAGFTAILNALEAATRASCQTLLTEYQAASARHDQVRRVESMLGWEHDVGTSEPIGDHPVERKVMLGLLARAEEGWLMPAAASVGVMALICGMVLGMPFALLLLLLAVVSLTVWTVTSSQSV